MQKGTKEMTLMQFAAIQYTILTMCYEPNTRFGYVLQLFSLIMCIIYILAVEREYEKGKKKWLRSRRNLRKKNVRHY